MTINTESSRVCPFCAESIKAAAKLCPRCRQWLTLRSLANPAVLAWLHVVPMLVISLALGATLLNSIDRLGNPKPYYSDFPQALHVVESKMNWVETKDGLRIFLTGLLTNQSPVAWGSIEFDCRFFDDKGALVDASNGHATLTIQPADDAAFRVVIVPGCETNAYHSYKLSVSTARNAKSWL